jgi:hypothetical protein
MVQFFRAKLSIRWPWCWMTWLKEISFTLLPKEGAKCFLDFGADQQHHLFKYLTNIKGMSNSNGAKRLLSIALVPIKPSESLNYTHFCQSLQIIVGSQSQLVCCVRNLDDNSRNQPNTLFRRLDPKLFLHFYCFPFRELF